MSSGTLPQVLVTCLVLGACAHGTDGDALVKEVAPTEPASASAPAAPDFPDEAAWVDPPPPAEVAQIFGHSATVLYRVDPTTKAVVEVGAFEGCGSVTDLALDAQSHIYATSQGRDGRGGLYRVEPTTARCTLVREGSYPNSLSFVPKGTVDPDREALVGFEDKSFVRIDLETGASRVIGALGAGDLVSSGDIVSVNGGKTFLTVKHPSGKGACGPADCLVELDPKTGKMLKNWGSIEHDNVFGLAFWGGSLYGFSGGGEVFEVTFGQRQLATVDIPVPGRPSGLRFWGAGSSTSVPVTRPPA